MKRTTRSRSRETPFPFEDQLVPLAGEGQGLLVGHRHAAHEPHADLEAAGHRRLAVWWAQRQAELAPAVEVGDLLLELELQALGAQGGDGRDPRGEGRPPGGAGAAVVVLLALLKEAGVDPPGGQLPVDGPGPLLLEDDPGDSHEVVPDREVADESGGRQTKAPGRLPGCRRCGSRTPAGR